MSIFKTKASNDKEDSGNGGGKKKILKAILIRRTKLGCLTGHRGWIGEVETQRWLQGVEPYRIKNGWYYLYMLGR